MKSGRWLYASKGRGRRKEGDRTFLKNVRRAGWLKQEWEINRKEHDRAGKERCFVSGGREISEGNVREIKEMFA
jgi:hypothetical protein